MLPASFPLESLLALEFVWTLQIMDPLPQFHRIYVSGTRSFPQSYHSKTS